jgi:hypothetical protein
MLTLSQWQPGRFLAMLVCLVAANRPASGQTASALISVPPTVLDAPLPPGLVVASEVPPVAPVDTVAAHQSTTLTALHISFGALQFMDALSTVRGINAGLSESHPLMRGLVGHPAAMVAVKAGAGATTILLTRRMARKNRVAALITMAGVNSAYAVVVARNLRAVGTQ